MSRSLGDTIVHRSGASAEPETLEHIVDEYDEFMIIATDGVWDVIDNNQAVQMVQNYSSKSPKWSPLDASNTICKFARSRWENDVILIPFLAIEVVDDPKHKKPSTAYPCHQPE